MTTRGLGWRTALRLGRVSNLPTVWSNVLAGVALAGAPLAVAPVLTLIAALSCVYVAGMYLNDACDADVDRVSQPQRPIPSGAAARSMVFAIGLALMAASLAGLAILGFARGTGFHGAAAGVALCGAVVVYDVWHKGNPIGPLLMGLCRALVYVTAAAAIAGAVPSPVLVAGLVSWIYVIGLTYAAKQAGSRRPRTLWPILCLAAPLVYGARSAAGGGMALGLVVLLAGTILAATRALSRAPPRAVALLIAGISLVDGLYLADQGHPVPAALTIAAFATTLGLQRLVAGT